MSSESEQREIGFAAIIFWDFVDEDGEDELLASLKRLYGEEPEQYGGVTLGGGNWRTRVVGNDTNHIEDAEEFASVRTLVESNTRGVFDVTTFAVLSDEQVQTVLNKKDRSGLRELRSTISEYLEMLPTYVDHDDPNHCGLYYAEWSEGDLLSDLEDATDESLVERLRSHHETLFSFGFQLGGNLSIYNRNFFVAPPASMAPFKGLAVIRRKQHPDSGPIDDLITSPTWYMGISGLNRYYRLNRWADSRWSRLNEFGSDADDARDSLLSLSSTQTDVDEVLPVSEEIQSLQIGYTEFRTRFDAEYQSFQDSFSERADEGTDTFGNPVDVPLPRPDGPDFVDRPEDRTNSVVEYFEDASEHSLEQTNDRYTQVSEKIESLVSSVDSRTRLAATDENLTLQERVQRLTAILTALTVILVILTIVLVGIELI